MYWIKMEVFLRGTSPTGTKYPQRNMFTFKANNVKDLWRWVNRKRKELEEDGFVIMSSRYEVTEV